MNNDWTDRLRDRMADYEMPVGDELWANIEQSLAQDEVFANKNVHSNNGVARSVVMRRFSIAASIAALLAGGAYVYFHPWNEVAENEVAAIFDKGPKTFIDKRQTAVPKDSQTAISDNNQKSISDNGQNAIYDDGQIAVSANGQNAMSKDGLQTLSGGGQTRNNILAQSNSVGLVSSESALSLDLDTQSSARSVNEKSETVPSSRSSRKVNSLITSEGDVMSSAQNGRRTVLAQSSMDEELGRKDKRHRGGLKLQLYGENGFIGRTSGGNSPVLMSSMPSSDPVFYDKNTQITSFFDERYMAMIPTSDLYEETKHHQPISVGMQVGFHLLPKLKLSTGLVYTKVSSDFISGVSDTRTVSTQDLHYIGIPLNLSYSVWEYKGLHTYVTAGGEGAVNIKNHTETDGEVKESKRDKMQWSTNASVGIQYDFIPQLGVYVEPGMKYYFDNGSQIENIFKDKKLNFNIQFGLRFNVGK
uniref:outer membrane beta-barrel protein n=1 Tax=Segatella hominis TaxID=2518605 RepID=UPI00402684A2